MSTPERTRLLELLADRALEGLSPSEGAELARLLAEHPDVDPDALDRAAAALACSDPEARVEPLPAELRLRLEKQAPALPPFAGRAAAAPEPQPAGRRFRTGKALATWSGWVVAAGLVVAVIGLATRDREPTVAEKFDRFLAAAGTWVRVEGAAPDPKRTPETAGEIYWSEARQEGYMKLHGLPRNDPARKQYQLWIFDRKRDDRYPVDGGVFDFAPGPGGEALVPIRPGVRVHEAAAFVITREPAGGVVVSDRKDVVLVAALPK